MINDKLMVHIKSLIDEGLYHVDDDKKAIIAKFGTHDVEALAVKGDNVFNINYDIQKKYAQSIYAEYKRKVSEVTEPSGAARASGSRISNPEMLTRKHEHKHQKQTRPVKKSSEAANGKPIDAGKEDKLWNDAFDKNNYAIRELKENIESDNKAIEKMGRLPNYLQDYDGKIQRLNKNDFTDIIKDQEHVIKELQEIKKISAWCLVRMKKKMDENAVANEKNSDIRAIIVTTLELEERIYHDTPFYQEELLGKEHLRKGNDDKRITYWRHRTEQARNKISLCAGNKLDNINQIANLKDKYRPGEIAGKFYQLYDNEWLEAYEYISGLETFKDKEEISNEKEIINILLTILMDAHSICKADKPNEANKINMNGKEKIEEKEDERIEKLNNANVDRITKVITASLDKKYNLMGIDFSNEHMASYVSECSKLCWHMFNQKKKIDMKLDDPFSYGKGVVFSKDEYKVFTKDGDVVDYIVWPALYIDEDGVLASKGVVQAKKS